MTTLQDARDELAGVLGWGRFEPGPYVNTGGWERHQEGKPVEVVWDPAHPVPDTIDGLAKLMPEGWAVWSCEDQNMRGEWYWSARGVLKSARPNTTGDTLKLQYGPTEYHARLLLTIAVLRAGAAQGKDRP